MQIIRDEGLMGNGLTTCLGIDWGIRRCNIAGCHEKILGAIVYDPENSVIYGLCEEHYQMINNAPGGMNITLDFTPLDDGEAVSDGS